MSVDQRVERRRLAARLAAWAGTIGLVVVFGLAVMAHLGVMNLHVVTSSSMRPVLQVNDLLITRTASAEAAAVGDIVTIRHPDGHLITHRVLKNEPNPDGSGRLIYMQGDDNDVADPQPYAVETVDATIVRIPLVGGALQTLIRPPANYIALGSLALLMIASLMPRRPSRTQET